MSHAKKPKRDTKHKVHFALAAPQAKEVLLVGDFNDWVPGARPLRRNKLGVWKTWTTLLPGTYEYRYLVDGEWHDDPACDRRVPNIHGTDNCLLVV